MFIFVCCVEICLLCCFGCFLFVCYGMQPSTLSLPTHPCVIDVIDNGTVVVMVGQLPWRRGVAHLGARVHARGGDHHLAHASHGVRQLANALFADLAHSSTLLRALVHRESGTVGQRKAALARARTVIGVALAVTTAERLATIETEDGAWAVTLAAVGRVERLHALANRSALLVRNAGTASSAVTVVRTALRAQGTAPTVNAHALAVETGASVRALEVAGLGGAGGTAKAGRALAHGLVVRVRLALTVCGYASRRAVVAALAVGSGEADLTAARASDADTTLATVHFRVCIAVGLVTGSAGPPFLALASNVALGVDAASTVGATVLLAGGADLALLAREALVAEAFGGTGRFGALGNGTEAVPAARL